MRWFGALIFVVFAGGCHLPAQMVWSPDGSKAAYRVGEHMLVIDESGKILAEPEDSIGGMAWTADSKTLYAALHVKAVSNPTGIATFPSATQPSEKQVVVGSWQGDGAFTPVFTLPDKPVWHMALSPDQSWLAVLAQSDPSNDGCTLYAFHLPSKKLMTVAKVCGMPMCFTGPQRLAFVEPADADAKLENQTGHLVEVQLAFSESLERKQLMNVIPSETIWMQCAGEDLLFSAAPMSYPSRARKTEPSICKLFHFSRADGSVCAIADDVGPLFSPSPDGKQILIEKLSVTDDKINKRELVLIKPNGSDGHVLRDITAIPNLPLWPSWKSTNEIVFVPPIDPARPLRVEADNTVRFDVVLYNLNEMFSLTPLRTLSEAWKMDYKPFYKVEPAATQPTTQPATQPNH